MFDVLGVPVLVNVIIFGKIEEKKTTPTNTCLNRKCMNPDSRCLSRAAYSVKNTYQNLHQESDIWISKKKSDHSKPKCPTLVKPSKVDGCCSAKKKRGPIRPPKNSHVYLLTRLVQKFRWPFFPDPVVIFSASLQEGTHNSIPSESLSYIPTVDGRNPKQPPGMYQKNP